MKDSVMSLTAAACGFVFTLLSVSVVHGQDDWGVSYSSTHICALKGGAVNISCTYRFPQEINGRTTEVVKILWFIKKNNGTPVDLITNVTYTNRSQNYCGDHRCVLTITDLREKDSGVYKFNFQTNQPGGGFIGLPGATLSVTDLQLEVISVQSGWISKLVHLKCQSSCPDHRDYVWFKKGQVMKTETSSSVKVVYHSTDSFSCAVRGFEQFPSPSVYSPKLPKVTVNASGEILEGSPVTLTCSSDANPAATYRWHKITQSGSGNIMHGLQLVFKSIQSIDSGEYFCKAANKMGWTQTTSTSVIVKYSPKLPSVSLSPSGEIEEGNSVTLTCSSDANPAANYSWYRENQTLVSGPEGIYRLSSISSEDRGNYSCKSENQHGHKSSYLSVDVYYAPKLPVVSASPSGEIPEGTSVTLSCSSDANPAATYTWYKEGEDTPKASGQTFTIINFMNEHSGNYSCEAQNNRGRQTSNFHQIVATGNIEKTVNIIRLILVVLMPIPLAVLYLWMKKKKSSPNVTNERIETIELDCGPAYENSADLNPDGPEQQEDQQ